MALAAFDRLGRIALGVPVRGRPVVILVLELHPADAVHLLVDELFVAGGAILRLLEGPFAEPVVLLRISADQKVARHATEAVGLPLPQILAWLRHRVVGIALHVRLTNRMTSQARDAFVVAVGTGELLVEQVLCSGEQRDGIVAPAAVPRGLRAILISHHLLDALKDRVHRRVTMGAGPPFLRDLLVATGRATRVRASKSSFIKRAAGIGVRQARCEGTIGPIEILVVGRKGVHVTDTGVRTRQPGDDRQAGHVAGRGHQQEALRGRRRLAAQHTKEADQHMRHHADRRRERGVEMHTPPQPGGFDAGHALPHQNHAGEQTDQQTPERHVPQQHDLRHAEPAIVLEMPAAINGGRHQHDQAGDGMGEHRPLRRSAEGSKGDGEARDDLEHQQGQAKAGQP